MKKIIFTIALFAQIFSLWAQSSKVDKFIDSFVVKNNFNGTILISKHTNANYKKSFGFANFQFKVPHTVDTKYKVASITKAFTSVLILQLYEQGEIDLQQTIHTYLPNYNGEGADKVTVVQLLNMTSGISNMDEGTTMEGVLKNGLPPYQKPYTPEEMLVKFCSGKLVREPGKEFDYNNVDFIILGQIIEKLVEKAFKKI